MFVSKMLQGDCYHPTPATVPVAFPPPWGWSVPYSPPKCPRKLAEAVSGVGTTPMKEEKKRVSL